MDNHERVFLIARDNRLKPIIGDYDTMFINFLERVQKLQPELFTTGLSIEDFSLRRIPRRGATTEEGNNNGETVAIKLINWCRKRE